MKQTYLTLPIQGKKLSRELLKAIAAEAIREIEKLFPEVKVRNK